jgi:hypothetical protein
VKRRVEDLTGQELDTAVALAEGWQLMFDGRGWVEPKFIPGVAGERIDCSVFHAAPLPWSTDWAHGGPLIDREQIAIYNEEHLWVAGYGIDARDGTYYSEETGSDSPTIEFAGSTGSGPTALIAAMRARVHAKFGDKINLP